MNLSSKYLIKLLEERGFVFKRSKGSHQLYYNSSTSKTVIAPVHGGKDLKRVHFWPFLNKPELIRKTFNYLAPETLG